MISFLTFSKDMIARFTSGTLFRAGVYLTTFAAKANDASTTLPGTNASGASHAIGIVTAADGGNATRTSHAPSLPWDNPGNLVTLESNVTTATVPFRPWDNPDSLMTFEQYLTTATVVNTVLLPIVLLIGAPMNVLSCFVFCKQGLRDRMNLCLFTLGLVDTIYLVSCFVLGFHSFINFWDEQLAREYNVKVPIYFGFIMWGMKVTSGCITTVVAIERCLCVVLPLRANSMMRTQTMGALLSVILIISVLGYSFTPIRYRVMSVREKYTGRTNYVVVVIDDFIMHHAFFDTLHFVILSFVVPLITFIVTFVATAITVFQLQSAMAWRAKTATSGKGDNQSAPGQHQAALTKMLVIRSCIFMACSLPITSLSVVRQLVPEFSPTGRYFNLFMATHNVAGNFINPVNSAVNFFVFYSRSKRFRVGLRWLFRRTKKETSSDRACEGTQVTETLTHIGQSPDGKGCDTAAMSKV